MKAISIMFGSLVMLGAVASMVMATPAHQKVYTDYYKGSKATCSTCHAGAPKLNAYGEALKAQMKGTKKLTPEILKACEDKRPK